MPATDFRDSISAAIRFFRSIRTDVTDDDIGELRDTAAKLEAMATAAGYPRGPLEFWQSANGSPTTPPTGTSDVLSGYGLTGTEDWHATLRRATKRDDAWDRKSIIGRELDELLGNVLSTLHLWHTDISIAEPTPKDEWWSTANGLSTADAAARLLLGDKTPKQKSRIMEGIRKRAGKSLRTHRVERQWKHHAEDWEMIVRLIKGASTRKDDNTDGVAIFEPLPTEIAKQMKTIRNENDVKKRRGK